MPLIDLNYFVRELQIGQIELPVVSNPVRDFIKVYEPQFLTLLLGKDLYKDFTDGLALDPVPQKWQDLKALLIDTDLKVSPIANYVYWFYMKNSNTRTGGIGEVKPNAENAQTVNNLDKRVYVWNEMVSWVWQNADELKTYHDDDIETDKPWFVINPSTYRGWEFWQYYKECPFEPVNSLGI